MRSRKEMVTLNVGKVRVEVDGTYDPGAPATLVDPPDPDEFVLEAVYMRDDNGNRLTGNFLGLLEELAGDAIDMLTDMCLEKIRGHE